MLLLIRTILSIPMASFKCSCICINFSPFSTKEPSLLQYNPLSFSFFLSLQKLLDRRRAFEVLSCLTSHDNPTVQLNALWALMVRGSSIDLSRSLAIVLSPSQQSASYQADTDTRDKLKLCFGYSRIFKYARRIYSNTLLFLYTTAPLYTACILIYRTFSVSFRTSLARRGVTRSCISWST